MRLIKRLSAVTLLAVCLAAIPAQGAFAGTFHLEINNSVLDLGGISGVKAIDSTSTPPDPPATLDGTIAGTTVDVPKAGFHFPTKHTDVSGISIAIDLEANKDITGSFDAVSGRMNLNASLKATVMALGQTCVIDPVEASLSTEGSDPYLGVRFGGGTGGPGALDGRWDDLPQPVGGSVCAIVGPLVAGPGGIWMSHDIVNPQKCADDPTHPGCSQDPCAKGATTECCETDPTHPGCGDAVGTAKLTMKVTPKSRRAKPGKKVVFRVKARNRGSAKASRVKICAKAPKRKVKGAKCRRGSIPAGGSMTKKFKLKLTKKAKGKIKVSFKITAANAAKRSAKATIKVKAKHHKHHKKHGHRKR